MANVLIAHIGSKMMNHMASYGDLLRSHGHEVIEIHFDSTSRINWIPGESVLNTLKKAITGESTDANNFEMVVIFDEYEQILNTIRNLLPAKVPVLYMDIFGEIRPVDGLIWFGMNECRPTIVLKEVDKITAK